MGRPDDSAGLTAEDVIATALAHYGVKGMKWGVRKGRDSSGQGKTPSAGSLRRASLKGLGGDQTVVTAKTKLGDTIQLEKQRPSWLHKALATYSESYANQYNEGAYFTIKDPKGKKVGSANLWMKSKDELYLNWITIGEKARGRGYASATLKAAESYGSRNGFKKMTLEVPANAPDARHIYEKLGFKVVKEEINPRDLVWGGLTSMEYTFPSKVKHADSGNPADMLWFIEELDKFLEEDMMHEDLDEATDKFLEHYGIKGMKWGVRRRRGADGLVEKSQDVQNAEAARAKITKKGDTSALSNKELQSLVTRMNLDQQYSRLAGEEAKAKKSSGKRVVQNILATGKTVNDVIAFVNSPAGKMVKDLLKKK